MAGIAEMAQHPDMAKDAALRAVGRTVVNFQRLEHNLKLAARLGPLNGTIQKIKRDIAKRHERASCLTLGQAIQAWLEKCDGIPEQHEGTPDLFDVTLQTTFTLETDDDSRNRHANALVDLLKKRNDLIHSRLAKFEWDSPQACESIVLELDSINAEILEQLQYVSTLLNAIAELSRDHADALRTTLVANSVRDA